MPNTAISVASSGANTLVTGVDNKKIRVWSYSYLCNGTVAVKFQTSSTDLTGAYTWIAQKGLVEPCGSQPLFDCAIGEPLIINLSASTNVNGRLMYEILGSPAPPAAPAGMSVTT